SWAEEERPLILIFGWMGAQLPHLYKYTEHYNKLYPLATQILVRAHASYFWGSETTGRAAVSPVIKLLRDAGIHENTMPGSSGLLVHAFSNGGALNEATLARAIAGTLSPTTNTSAIPAQALIYDSPPGVLNIRVTLLAFTAAMALRSLLSSVLSSKPFWGYFTFWARRGYILKTSSLAQRRI
ncbi:hypothetical protein RSAG8_14013, partial [Rhizoctonia solani AG-8 WAC10335]